MKKLKDDKKEKKICKVIEKSQIKYLKKVKILDLRRQ